MLKFIYPTPVAIYFQSIEGDERKSKIHFLHQRKRKALIDLFKYLHDIGKVTSDTDSCAHIYMLTNIKSLSNDEID